MQIPLHYYRNNMIGAINLLEVRIYNLILNSIYFMRKLIRKFKYFLFNLLMIQCLQVMKAAGCFQLVFSSSCTVYGEPKSLPITEDHPTGNITNVYGRTKFFIEEMLNDITAAEKVIKKSERRTLFKNITSNPLTLTASN